MFIFSDDKHDNMSLLSDLYSAECSRIGTLCVCKQERRQLHDIVSIMTRSMSQAKQADVPAIYPLKCEHRKPEHVKPDEVKGKTGGEQDVHGQYEKTNNAESVEMPDMEELPEIPKVHEQHGKDIYQVPVIDKQVRRPNPLLEPSSYPQVMSKQLPKYEGMLNLN